MQASRSSGHARLRFVLIVTFGLTCRPFDLPAQESIPKVAVITTVWRHNAHADVIASRLVQGNTLDGKGEFPKLKLVSAYVDQFPENDMSRPRVLTDHAPPRRATHAFASVVTVGSGPLNPPMDPG